MHRFNYRCAYLTIWPSRITCTNYYAIYSPVISIKILSALNQISQLPSLQVYISSTTQYSRTPLQDSITQHMMYDGTTTSSTVTAHAGISCLGLATVLYQLVCTHSCMHECLASIMPMYTSVTSFRAIQSELTSCSFAGSSVILHGREVLVIVGWTASAGFQGTLPARLVFLTQHTFCKLVTSFRPLLVV
jgi:hypothetical protein